MAVRVAINGFGRIGRNFLRAVIEQEKATGPFRWTPQRMIEFNDTDGTRVEINAGELIDRSVSIPAPAIECVCAALPCGRW